MERGPRARVAAAAVVGRLAARVPAAHELALGRVVGEEDDGLRFRYVAEAPEVLVEEVVEVDGPAARPAAEPPALGPPERRGEQLERVDGLGRLLEHLLVRELLLQLF